MEDSKPIIVLEDVKVTLNGCKEVNVMLFQMQDVEAYTTVIKVKVTLNGCKEVNVMLFQMQDVEAYTAVIKRIVKWQGMDRGHGYYIQHVTLCIGLFFPINICCCPRGNN